MNQLSQNDVGPDSRYSLAGLPSALRANVNILFLIILNFFTHFLFLPLYGFYSDDWSILAVPFMDQYSYVSLLLESERPLFWIMYKIQYDLFGANPLGHHLLGFLTSCIVLVLVYEIAKKIFRDIGQPGDYYPFLTAAIFCVLFNKDEVYPWAILSSGFPYIAYLASCYFYLHKDRKYFLALSLIAYTLGLFSYEIGLALPLLFLFYDYVITRKEKTGFLFFIPLLVYLAVRMTNWFGYGFAFVSRGVGNWELATLLTSGSHLLLYSIVVFSRQITLAVIGFAALAWWQWLGLISLSCVLAFFLGILLKREEKAGRVRPIFFILSIIMVMIFLIPFILKGSMSTRHFILIDLGIALFIAGLLSYAGPSKRIHWVLIAVVGICILLNLGLYVNWVISGNIQEDVSQYIEQNSDQIANHKWVYFDAQSFMKGKPNHVANPFTRWIKGQWFRGNESLTSTQGDSSTENQGNEDITVVYSPYYNSPCLDRWALVSMIQKYVPSFRSDQLIYGNEENIPEAVTEDRIIFRDINAGDIRREVLKSDCSTISYESIYGVNVSSFKSET